MTSNPPRISIVIPTHNRHASLRRTLNALSLQTYPTHLLEVVVVADGCTDETVEALRRYPAQFTLHVISQSGQGAGAARNHGAYRASGSVLLFLDDDVEPAPTLVEAHLNAHRTRPEHAIMGPYVPFAKSRTAFFHIMLRNWWHDKFRTMSRAGHRYTYRDLLSGNLSISKEIFTAVGGFDSSVRCAGGEDYEFGARLIKAGVPFAFVAEALAYHHEYETTTLDRSLQRSRQEGYADVVIGRRHPELRPTLFLANFQEPKSIFDHIVHGLAYRCPKGGDIAAAWLRRVLNVLETLRVRSLWRKLFIGLRHYWYLRGAAEELGSRKNLIRFFQGSPTNLDRSESEIGIDIANGWDEAEKQLDQKNPTGVRLTYRGRPIGHIPSQPGAEPLRGRHLRPMLVGTELAWLTLRPLIMNDASSQDENVTKPDIDFGEKQCRA